MKGGIGTSSSYHPYSLFIHWVNYPYILSKLRNFGNRYLNIQSSEMLIWIAFDRILRYLFSPARIIILYHMLMLYLFPPILLFIWLFILWY